MRSPDERESEKTRAVVRDRHTGESNRVLVQTRTSSMIGAPGRVLRRVSMIFLGVKELVFVVIPGIVYAFRTLPLRRV